MPRNKLFGEWFKPQKWKWYVVDLTNLHKPVLIRKHLENKSQAVSFKERYYNTKEYDIVNWKQVKKFDLDHGPKSRKHKIHTTKWLYPEGCVTRHQKQLYRFIERRKMTKDKRLPKVTLNAIYDILEEKPVKFIKRLKAYRDNHWVYTEPVEGLRDLKKKYKWPEDLVYLSNIIRALTDYYNVGLYSKAEVAIFIYERWKSRVKAHCDVLEANPTDISKILAEFKARGFITKTSIYNNKTSFVEVSYLIPERLVYPELCWHSGNEIEKYEHYTYDLQALVGIPGYTTANTKKPEGVTKKRKKRR